jgi:hypothetical protein
MNALMNALREELANDFEANANWRANWASGSFRPMTDHKNTTYAESLRNLANYVRGLPDDDPVLMQLAKIDLNLDNWHTHTIHVGCRECSFAPSDCPKGFAEWAQPLIDHADRPRREQALRREAKRQGLIARKSRRDGSWMFVDAELGCLVSPQYLGLEQARAWLLSPVPPARQWCRSFQQMFELQASVMKDVVTGKMTTKEANAISIAVGTVLKRQGRSVVSQPE